MTPRLAAPDPGRMTPEQARVHADIASGPRGSVRGPLAVWLHRPDLADAAQKLGAYCRYRSSLPARLSELAILTTAKIWNSEYEWATHVPHARAAGLPEAVVSAIRAGEEPPFEREDERVVHRFVAALHVQRQVSDRLYAQAVAALGTEGVVDLVGIAGYYALISMTINVFQVPPD